MNRSKPIAISPEILLIVFLALLTVLYFNAGKPFQLDEAYPFATNAHVIDQRGVQVLGERAAPGSQDTALEIAHPPLYPISLSLVFRIFGETNTAGRLFGVFCLFLTLWILRALSRALYPQDSRAAWIASAVLLLSSPFILQFSLLLDIDNTVLTPWLILTLFLVVRFLKFGKSGHLIWAGLSLGAAFWAKELTPPVIPAALFLYYLLRREWKNAVAYPLILGGVGLAFFTATWLLFCVWTHVPPLVFIRFLLSKKGVFFFNFTYVQTILYVVKLLIAWLSPALMLLIGMWAVQRLKFLKKGAFPDREDFLKIWVLVMALYTSVYIPMTTNLPLLKYSYPLFPVLLLMIGHWLVPHLQSLKWPSRIRVLLGIAGTWLWLFLVFKQDPLRLAYQNRLSFTGRPFLVLWTPALALPFLWLFVEKYKPVRTRLVLGLFAALIGFNLYTNLRQTGDYTTAPSWDIYGEEGLQDAAAYIAEHADPAGRIVARKDIGYYLNFRLNRPDIEWLYPLFRGPRPQCEVDFERVLASGIQYIVLDPSTNRRAAAEIIFPSYKQDKTFGDFTVYKRIPEDAPADSG